MYYARIRHWLYTFPDMIIWTNVLLNVLYIVTVAINIGWKEIYIMRCDIKKMRDKVGYNKTITARITFGIMIPGNQWSEASCSVTCFTCVYLTQILWKSRDEPTLAFIFLSVDGSLKSLIHHAYTIMFPCYIIPNSIFTIFLFSS
jgi:hypothetical protein